MDEDKELGNDEIYNEGFPTIIIIII